MKHKPPDETQTTQTGGTPQGGAAGGTQGGAGAGTPPAAGAAGAAGTPPAAGTQGTPPPPAQGGTQAGAGAGGAQPDGPVELLEDQEPTPGKKLVLTTEALNKRISRASRAALRDVVGTEDPAEGKKKMARLTELEAGEEERKRSQMTKEQQLTADLEKERERANTAEARAQQLEDDRVVASDGEQLKVVASEFIKPKFWKAASADLADYLSEQFTAEQLDAMNDKQREEAVRTFFTGYVKENPELAKEAAAGGGGGGGTNGAGAGGTNGTGGTQGGKNGTTPTREPLRNGTANPKGKGADAKPPTVISSGKFAGKTLKPGLPNSLTKSEYEEWKRETGNNY